MGLEKYFAGIFMILLALIAFSSFFHDSLAVSGKATNTPYEVYLNDTNKYYSGLSNQTNQIQSAIAPAGLGSTASFDLFGLFSQMATAVASTITITLASLGIFFSLSGILSIVFPVAAIFIGLGITWIVISWLLSLLKGIRLGDTSG